MIERYLAGQSRRKEVDSLGDHILELRHRRGNNHYRVLFTLRGGHCVGLTSFYKNQQQTRRRTRTSDQIRRKRWIQLFGKEPPEN